MVISLTTLQLNTPGSAGCSFAAGPAGDLDAEGCVDPSIGCVGAVELVK